MIGERCESFRGRIGQLMLKTIGVQVDEPTFDFLNSGHWQCVLFPPENFMLTMKLSTFNSHDR